MTLLLRSHFKARPRVSDIEARLKSFPRQCVNLFTFKGKHRSAGSSVCRMLAAWALTWPGIDQLMSMPVLIIPCLGCKRPHAAAKQRRAPGLLPAVMAPPLEPRLSSLVSTEATLPDPAAARTGLWNENLVHSDASGLLWARFADHTTAGLDFLHCTLCWQNYIVARFLQRQNQLCPGQMH